MRLQDGIHGYLRHVKQEIPGEPSMWVGENFVFDKRQTWDDSDSEPEAAERGE